MRQVIRPLTCGLIVVVLVVLAGCGGSVGKPAGKITMKGTPVGGAEIAFKSATDEKAEFFGVSGDDGTYVVSYRELRGIPVGKYTVIVTRYTLAKGKALPAGESGDALRDSGKAKKESFKFDKDITSGTNALDFELSQGTKFDDAATPSRGP